MAEARHVGLTKDAGWEIGVSRTVPHPLDEVWRLLTSDEGLALWLGEGALRDGRRNGGRGPRVPRPRPHPPDLAAPGLGT